MRKTPLAFPLNKPVRLSKTQKKSHDEKVKAAETEYEKTIFYAKKQKEAGIITEEQYKELEAAAKAHKEEQKGTADDTYYGVLNSVKKNLGENLKVHQY